MSQVMVLIIMTSVLFGSWPLIARAAGQAGATGSLLLTVFALIPVLVATLFKGWQLPSLGNFAKLGLAGIIMGSGLVVYNFIITDATVDISKSTPVINVLVMAITAFGGILFFAEALTLPKVIGVIFFAIGIFLMRPSA